jgi:hypothetical protein
MAAVGLTSPSQNTLSRYLLFGYLYYHFDHKHRDKTSENASVHLFAPKAGHLQNAVNSS